MVLEDRIQSTNFRKSDHSRSAEKLLEEGVLTQERRGRFVASVMNEKFPHSKSAERKTIFCSILSR
jgi:hypothetical protein